MSIADGVLGDDKTDGAGETMSTVATGLPNVTPGADSSRGFLCGGGVTADELELLAIPSLCLLSAASLSSADALELTPLDFRAYRK